MANILWGEKWTKRHPTEEAAKQAIQEWGETMQTMSDASLKQAVGRSKLECEWPPTIAEFYKLGKIEKEKAMYKRNDEALALPKSTWGDRKQIGMEAIAQIKEKLDEPALAPENPTKRVVYGDDYFAARGYRKYKPGEEELKSYIPGGGA